MRGAGSSPPTARVVRVVEYLASRPTTAMTTTEIARDLGIARATCALVLDELTECGWLVRIDGGYVLGPRVVPVGRAALASRGGALEHHGDLEALADALGVVCTTSSVIGEYIVVMDCAGPVRTDGFDVRVGMRYPFAPPSGIVHVAWEPDHVVDAWLQRAPQRLDDDDLNRLWAVVRDVRERGVHVDRLTSHVFQIQALLADLATEELPDALRRAVGGALAPFASRGYRNRELRSGRRYAVSLVVAPAFDADGRQRFAVGAFVARSDVTYRELQRITALVRETAERITAWAGGRDPWR
jgi:DNA-binding IclR family transcriptional regulator